jgi:CelD/BcsL family acetyltransferase involved in cellulose biosynthesis
MMHARIMRSIAQIGFDEHGWNSMLIDGNTNTVFQTYQWSLCWWNTYGDQYEPLFVTVSNRQGVVGIAPLVVETALVKGHGRVVRFLGDGRADYCDFLASADKAQVLGAVFDTLFAIRDRWDMIELNNIPVQSRTLDIVSAICKRIGLYITVDDHFVCPTLLIEGHEKEALSVLNKQSLKRRQNYFQREGRLVVHHMTSAAEIEPYLDQFFSQHIKRWGGGKGQSLFLEDRNRAFYRELTSTIGSKGWLLFTIVEFNDQPIAFHYGFEYDSTLVWYKPSYAVEYASHSPGLVLMRNLIGYAIENKLRQFDLTVGDEPFKTRFSNWKRKTVRLRIFQKLSPYVVDCTKRYLFNMIKKSISSKGRISMEMI